MCYRSLLKKSWSVNSWLIVVPLIYCKHFVIIFSKHKYWKIKTKQWNDIYLDFQQSVIHSYSIMYGKKLMRIVFVEFEICSLVEDLLPSVLNSHSTIWSPYYFSECFMLFPHYFPMHPASALTMLFFLQLSVLWKVAHFSVCLEVRTLNYHQHTYSPLNSFLLHIPLLGKAFFQRALHAFRWGNMSL